jgi:mono/diheme cytochrome c family protein
MTVPTPIESRSRALPLWAVVFTVIVLVVGGADLAGNLVGENPAIGGAGGGNVAAQAQAIITSAGCEACHAKGLTGNIGPNLHTVKDGPVVANLQDLATAHPDDWANLWIAGTDPAVAGIDRGGMPVFGGPPYNLTADQIATVVEYLKSLQ